MPLLTPTSSLRRILISRTDGLGDVILTLPIAVALREYVPQADVAFMVAPQVVPLLHRIQEVDTVLSLSTPRGAKNLIREYRPDAIIFARPEASLALAAIRARIDVRIGTGYRWYSGLFTRWVYDRRRRGGGHEAEYGLNLLGPLLDDRPDVRLPELPVDPDARESAREFLREHGIDGEFTVLHPGGKGSAPLYSPEQYVAALKLAARDGLDRPLVITAGPGEEDLAERIASDLSETFKTAVASGLTLNELSELLRLATLYIGGSTGPTHLASLVRAPIVALYPAEQPLWPTRWGPLGENVTVLTPEGEPGNDPNRIEPSRLAAALR